MQVQGKTLADMRFRPQDSSNKESCGCFATACHARGKGSVMGRSDPTVSAGSFRSRLGVPSTEGAAMLHLSAETV